MHVSSGRRVPSRIDTCRECIEKVKSGVLRIGHVFMVFTRVSNGPNPACAESACIVMYRACPNWGEGIHRYRKVSPVSCIEYVSRGPRLTHFFKTCEIHEIHARYQGNKMEEYRITIPVKKRAIHYDTWYWGETDPILGGNRPLIRAELLCALIRRELQAQEEFTSWLAVRDNAVDDRLPAACARTWQPRAARLTVWSRSMDPGKF